MHDDWGGMLLIAGGVMDFATQFVAHAKQPMGDRTAGSKTLF
jgi:hypothetical protein